MGEKCNFIIERESKALAGAVYKVEIDGITVGNLKARSHIEVNLEYGCHQVSFYQWGKCKKSIQINISPEDNSAKIFVIPNAWTGNIDLQTQNTTAMFTQSSNSGNFKSNGNKSVGWQSGCLIVFVVFFVIAILVVIISSTSSKSSSDTAAVNYEEMSSEEAANAMLSVATEKFENNKYVDALKTCAEIIEKYPDSSAAINMAAYKSEQLSKYLNVDANTLMSSYQENVVNADETYTGKAVVLTGTVSSISKNGFNDNNLVVLLKSNALFAAVQLNFNKDNTTAVASLKEGDIIKVVGNCTGKSGKQFVFFDGLNVMIENCVVIN